MEHVKHINAVDYVDDQMGNLIKWSFLRYTATDIEQD